MASQIRSSAHRPSGPAAATSPPAARTSRRTQGLSAEFPDGLVDTSRKPEKPRIQKTSKRSRKPLEPQKPQQEQFVAGRAQGHLSANESVLSWVQSVQKLAEEGVMAPPAANSVHRQLRRKARKAPNRDVERVASTLDASSENDGTMQLSYSSNNGSKTAGIYRSSECRAKLKTGNGFVHMYMSERELFSSRRGPYHGLNGESEMWIRDLKEHRPESPKNGLFDPRSFGSLLERVDGQNEVGVTQNLQDLVCPVVAKLAVLHLDDDALGDTYDLLEDRWDQQWIKLATALPGFGRPKPDYCVGFALSAYTDEQQRKLEVIASEKAALKPTALMHFPFLTCEVKSWQQSIDFAENQNGHNIFVAVQAMVELFRMAEMDVSGQILAFSVAYNHSLVYIHAYYPIISGEKTNICRHTLGTYLLSPSENPDLWRSWRLIRNVYEMWAPELHRRLCEAIDSLKFDVSRTAAPDVAATPTPSDSAAPTDGRLETTPRSDDMSTDGLGDSYSGGHQAALKESGQQQPSTKRLRMR